MGRKHLPRACCHESAMMVNFLAIWTLHDEPVPRTIGVPDQPCSRHRDWYAGGSEPVRLREFQDRPCRHSRTDWIVCGSGPGKNLDGVLFGPRPFVLKV